MKKLFLLHIAVFFSVSCASAPVKANSDVFRYSDNDVIIHTASETLFPVRLAGLQRVQTMVYNANGLDVSANYLSENPGLLITAYIYPSDGRRREEFASVVNAMKQVNPTLKLIEEGISESNGQEGLRVVYEGISTWNNQSQPVYTYAVLYEYFGWYVKFRITHPKAELGGAIGALQAFGKAFVFPGVDRRRI